MGRELSPSPCLFLPGYQLPLPLLEMLELMQKGAR
jgi:hypothetical protein